MKLKGKLISLISLFLTIMIAWYVMKIGNTIPKYWDFGIKFPKKDQLIGLDVSHYQGQVYWEEVDEMSIDGDSLRFVYIKASEGTTIIDDKYETNQNAIEKTDLYFGAYHYFHPSSSSQEQAYHFLRQIGNEFSLKPVLDVEISGELSNSALSDSIKVFLDIVEKKTGSRPLIYTYESFYLDYIDISLKEQEYFWIASYNKNCDLYSLENVLMWQFSEKGTVNGISTKVDLNLAKPATFNKVKK